MIRHLSFTTLIFCLIAAPASAAISVTSISRSVKTDVGNGAPQDFTSTSAGPYNASFMSSSNLDPAGTIVANASQSSFVPNLVDTFMNGNGATRGQANATGDAVYSVTADSALDVYFTVTASQTYTLNSNVFWTNTLAGTFSGYSRVQLWDITNNIVPHDVQRDSMISGIAALNQQIPLSTGAIYRLRAESHVFGGGDTAGVFTADAAWDFTLTVPEPTSAMLVSIALFITTGITARRRNLAPTAPPY